MGANLTSVHSDEEMRHVLNLFSSQLKRDTEAGLHNDTYWANYIAFLGIRRNRVNDTQWINYDNSTFDYGDPMGQEGRWPWCREEGGNLNQTIVRLGPFDVRENKSVPFEDPRNYGCWFDASVTNEAPYAICKKPVAGNVAGSSRDFYYEPEGPPTETPKPKKIRAAGSSQELPAEAVEDETTATERHDLRRPDRHA
ncbi:hypothetical protein AAVH_09122 [Aphelenchoides avenae]|nr:hypothetical protein AAVH_09122 [Aphelenchus avenae]